MRAIRCPRVTTSIASARAGASAALVLLGVSVATVANAQATGFALDAFAPSERGSEWFALESLDLRGHLRPAVGAVVDYAYRPLVVYAPDGTVGASVVRDQMFFRIGGSVTLVDRVRLGLDVPIAIYQRGHTSSRGGITYTAPDTADLGDMRVACDVRLVGVHGDAFTLAAGFALFLPTGRRASFTSDETLRVEPRALAAGEAGWFVYALKLGFEYRPYDATFAGAQLGSAVDFGAAVGVKVLSKALVIGPELYGSTVVGNAGGGFARDTTPVEGIFGGHFTFFDEWRLGGGVGTGLWRGHGAPSLRMLGSVEWTPSLDVRAGIR